MDKFVIKKTGWTYWFYKLAWCVGFRYSRGDDFCKLVRRFLLAVTLLAVMVGGLGTIFFIIGTVYHNRVWEFGPDAAWYLYIVSFLSLPVLILSIVGVLYLIIKCGAWLVYSVLIPWSDRLALRREKRWEEQWYARLRQEEKPTPQWRVALRAWAQKYCIKIDME